MALECLDLVAVTGKMAKMWLDGEDGQEDELDDVAKGKLQPPTPKADQVPGDIVIRPNRDEALIEEDEEGNGGPEPVN